MKGLTFKETKLRIQYVALWNKKSSQHLAWSVVLHSKKMELLSSTVDL